MENLLNLISLSVSVQTRIPRLYNYCDMKNTFNTGLVDKFYGLCSPLMPTCRLQACKSKAKAME